MKIVLLTGAAQSGKSTVATHLERDGYKYLKFATPLKQMCKSLGLSDREVDGDLKEVPIEHLGGVTSRKLQQTLGTEWGRNMIDPDIWVRIARQQVAVIQANTNYNNFLFDDVRFPNEIAIFRDSFGLDVTVINIIPDYKGYVPIEGASHASETQELPWDYQIHNRGPVYELLSQVEAILEMNYFKNLLIGAALVLNRFMPAQDEGVIGDITTQGEVKPEVEMDEWLTWYHHDDITLEEEAMLFSNDPELILEAEQAISKRQAEVEAIRNDPDKFREMFNSGYLKNADLNKPQTPMSEREGWEDDDDMPETFVGVNQETGDLEEIRFDELPEWENNK